jgi:hypothetical protein
VHRVLVPVVSTVAATASALTLAAAPASAAVTCAKYAAPTGSDAAAGTADAPLRSAQKLADSLSAGQTGCLTAGTYSGDLSIGTAGITLTSAPGGRAKIVGRLWIKEHADGVTLSSLDLDGINAARLPSPTVNGNDATFSDDDVTNDHTEICFLIGSSWGRAQRTVISANRIHDCGKIPSSNQDHGIYVADADDTQILGNLIYDNVDRGVQLYPDAQRTIIRGNIIDGNGEGIIFSGADGTAASGSVVEGNIIANARIRTNVESWYPSGNPIGRDNVVRNNCIGDGAGGSTETSGGGFTLSGNVSADPQFVDRAAGDLRLKADACSAMLAGYVLPGGGTPTAPTGTVPPLSTTTTPPATTTTTPTTTTTTTTAPVKRVVKCTYTRVDGKRVKRCVRVTAKTASVRGRSRTVRHRRTRAPRHSRRWVRAHQHRR